MKEMFLDDLPKKINKGKECIDWKNSAGYKVHFIYDDIEGSLKIIKYIIKNNHPYLEVEYNDKTYICSSKSIIKCSLGKMLNKITKDFKVEIGQTFKDEKRDLTIIDREYRLQKSNNQDTKWYKYHCNICGAELWMIESDLLNGTICACCSNKTVVKGINDISAVAEETMAMTEECLNIAVKFRELSLDASNLTNELKVTTESVKKISQPPAS